MKKNIINIIVIFLALLTLFIVYIVLDANGYFTIYSEKDSSDGYFELKYMSIGCIEDQYYISFFIENNSNKAINSTFKMTLDILYKDEYIIKDKLYIYNILEQQKIKPFDIQMIDIKITKEQFEKYKNIDPLSDDVTAKIINIESDEDIKWLKE